MNHKVFDDSSQDHQLQELDHYQPKKDKLLVTQKTETLTTVLKKYSMNLSPGLNVLTAHVPMRIYEVNTLLLCL